MWFMGIVPEASSNGDLIHSHNLQQKMNASSQNTYTQINLASYIELWNLLVNPTHDWPYRLLFWRIFLKPRDSSLSVMKIQCTLPIDWAHSLLLTAGRGTMSSHCLTKFLFQGWLCHFSLVFTGCKAHWGHHIWTYFFIYRLYTVH